MKALYIVEDGEAVDVRHFCSDDCRQAYRRQNPDDAEYKDGISDDFVQGTVCDECGDTRQRTTEQAIASDAGRAR